MKWKLTLVWGLIVLGSLTFSSCKYTPPAITDVRNFEMKTRPDQSKALVMEMRIENKNWVGFKLKNPLATVKINGTEIGRAEAPFQLKVKARSNNYQTIELTSDVSFAQAIQSLLFSLQSGKVKLEVDGSMTVKAPFYKKPLLFKVDKEYAFKDLMKF